MSRRSFLEFVPFTCVSSRFFLQIAAAFTGVILSSPIPHAAMGGLSFSGDVILNTGSPNGSVFVGRQSIGSLQLDNGTTFTSGLSQLGSNPTGIGTATVTGPRTAWTTTTMDVGLGGIGRLDIEQGAVVDATRLQIGGQSGAHGEVLVDGPGSTLQVRGPLLVGTPAGVGELAISNGGIVNAVQTPMTNARNGRVVLDDGLLRTTSLTSEGVISGSGEIQILSSSTMNLAGRLQANAGDHLLVSGVTGSLQNLGIIAAHGGEIEIRRPINNSRQGTLTPGEITLQNGTLRVVGSGEREGIQLTNAGLIAAIGGENHFYGRIQSAPTIPTVAPEIAITNNSVMIFHDDVILQSGMMTVFAGSKATLLEDLSLASGSQLLANISGSSVDIGYGEIEVVGNLQLGGQLRVAFSDGFLPSAGDSFPILTSHGGISGELTFGEMPTLPDGLKWDLDVGATQVVLNVVSAPAGDYNVDGVVDAADYVVWRRSAGQSGSNLAADGNNDGVVDTSDYNFWRSRIGHVTGNSAGPRLAASIPEPATYIGLTTGLILVLAKRRTIITERAMSAVKIRGCGH
jgi:T5SS/PEP-CTERM-associated repeat protein